MSEYAGTGFARFMELRGHRVVEGCGVLWHHTGYGMYMSLPYHQRIDLAPNEARHLVRSIGATGVRYPSRRWIGLSSGLYVCRRRDYRLSSLHRNFRSLVKHGLPACEVRPVTESELLTRGLEINRETMRRQRRYDPEFGDQERWRRFVSAVESCPQITAIGSFVDGCLASYGVTSCEDGYLEVLYKMTDLKYDSWHPSQVLDFTITQRIATDPAVIAVSLGWVPLVPKTGLHEYKVRLGFECEPQYSVIQLHPAVEHTLASRPARAALNLIRAMRGPSQVLDMTAAVLEGAAHTRAQSPPPAGTRPDFETDLTPREGANSKQ